MAHIILHRDVPNAYMIIFHNWNIIWLYYKALNLIDFPMFGSFRFEASQNPMDS